MQLRHSANGYVEYLPYDSLISGAYAVIFRCFQDCFPVFRMDAAMYVNCMQIRMRLLTHISLIIRKNMMSEEILYHAVK